MSLFGLGAPAPYPQALAPGMGLQPIRFTPSPLARLDDQPPGQGPRMALAGVGARLQDTRLLRAARAALLELRLGVASPLAARVPHRSEVLAARKALTVPRRTPPAIAARRAAATVSGAGTSGAQITARRPSLEGVPMPVNANLALNPYAAGTGLVNPYTMQGMLPVGAQLNAATMAPGAAGDIFPTGQPRPQVNATNQTGLGAGGQRVENANRFVTNDEQAFGIGPWGYGAGTGYPFIGWGGSPYGIGAGYGAMGGYGYLPQSSYSQGGIRGFFSRLLNW